MHGWRGVTGRVRPIQARGAHAGAALLATASLLAGCSSGGSLNPVDWWHGLQAGPIADVRPPPPEADAPYPNLSSVPARPTPQDLAGRGRIMSGLVADRANAKYTASQSPIGTVPPPSAPPKPPSPATAADADDVSGATLQAASAPPTPAAPPPRPAPARKAEPTSSTAPIVAHAMPDIPGAPPPPPAIPGVAAATAPAPPPPTPLPVVVATPQVAGAPVGVAFAPGSAVLPPAAAGALTQLAKTRGAATVSVTGFGDASGTDAAAQSAALPLALTRARAIAASLLAAGVPSSGMTLGAEATGRGGVAQVVN